VYIPNVEIIDYILFALALLVFELKKAYKAFPLPLKPSVYH
jgi:hypothetical protein